MQKQSKIPVKLKQIQKVFNIDEILMLKPDKAYIQKYYKANKLAYSMFHTYSDKIYMGVSRDGVYKEDDLLEAARTVEKYIKSLTATTVLELATGRGATSVYLAEKYPDVRFQGIEISPGQLDFSKKKARKLKNYQPIQGDYHDLSAYKDASTDVVFVIEALCYSEDKAKVLREVKRILKPGGVFIILDGYIKISRSKMSDMQKKAILLTEKGMAVSEFEEYPILLNEAKTTEFTIESSEDVSPFIMPTLRRFEHLAKRFFKRPHLAKIVTKIFSKEFAYNAVSGLLMPDLIEENLASYYITVLRSD